MKQMFDIMVNTRAKYLAIAGAILIIALSYFGFESTEVEVEKYTVLNDEFIVSVVTSGEIIAQDSRVISAPTNVRSNLQIVELVEEGTRVKKGDFLIRFDTADIENRLLTKEEEMKSLQLQREEMVEKQKAEMVQKEAAYEVQKYSHEQAKIRYELMKFEPEIKQRQQEIDMKKADLELLEAGEEIKRLKLENGNELRRIDEKIRRKQNEIDEYQAQIEACNITAPIDGLVVLKQNYMANRDKMKVGQSVHRRMQLIELPDLSVMKVETAVNEVDISKIRPGQEVIITLDANENTYYGTVSNIARLARNEENSTTIKVFDVEVMIKNNDDALKPGMSATCQIITDKIADATFVPLQSVFEEEGETFVYVGDGFKKTNVVTGERNTDFIVIKEGVLAGEEVALRDPFARLEAIGKEVKEKPAAKPNTTRPDQNAVRHFRGRMMR